MTLSIRSSVVILAALLLSVSAIAQETPSGKAEQPTPQGGAVQFVSFEETGNWATFRNERFSLRKPAGWTVSLNQDESEEGKWYYEVANEKGTAVFDIYVVRGGPEWIGCFCAPYENYEFTQKGPYKIWALTNQAQGLTKKFYFRTVKVATGTMRLDVHVDLSGLPTVAANRIRYVAESARPVEPQP